jgi:hypothetical protein
MLSSLDCLASFIDSLIADKPWCYVQLASLVLLVVIIIFWLQYRKRQV